MCKVESFCSENHFEPMKISTVVALPTLISGTNPLHNQLSTLATSFAIANFQYKTRKNDISFKLPHGWAKDVHCSSLLERQKRRIAHRIRAKTRKDFNNHLFTRIATAILVSSVFYSSQNLPLFIYTRTNLTLLLHCTHAHTKEQTLQLHFWLFLANAAQ